MFYAYAWTPALLGWVGWLFASNVGAVGAGIFAALAAHPIWDTYFRVAIELSATEDAICWRAPLRRGCVERADVTDVQPGRWPRTVDTVVLTVKRGSPIVVRNTRGLMRWINEMSIGRDPVVPRQSGDNVQRGSTPSQ